jgi:hypothetical protein
MFMHAAGAISTPILENEMGTRYLQRPFMMQNIDQQGQMNKPFSGQ